MLIKSPRARKRPFFVFGFLHSVHNWSLTKRIFFFFFLQVCTLRSVQLHTQERQTDRQTERRGAGGAAGRGARTQKGRKQLAGGRGGGGSIHQFTIPRTVITQDSAVKSEK